MSVQRATARLWIKICGLTTADAVDAALSNNVDAVGFVFAESSRRLEPARAAELASPARGRARCVAVMRRPTQAEVDRVIADFRPDVLQTDLEDFAHLKLPDSIERLCVLRAGEDPRGLPARLLFEGPVSGAGQATDWVRAADLARRHDLILAGGLSPDNVAAAIGQVRPFGVDVSSGVESRPGIKSAAKIAAFVAAAREAAAEAAPHDAITCENRKRDE